MIKKSPSRLHRLMNCPGSGKLAENIVEFTNPAALKGREAHAIVLGALQKEDPSLAEGTEYAAHADFLYSVIAGVEKFEVERFLPALQYLGMTLEGREGEHQADLIYWHEGVLYVLDYKSGAEPVSPIGNEQLMAYAWAYCTEEDVWPKKIRLEIYQPKANRLIWAHVISGEKLKAWGFEVQARMKEVDEGKEVKEGEWCKWCPAASVCPLKLQAKQDRQDRKELIVAEGLQVLQLAPALDLDSLEKLKAQLATFTEPIVEKAKELKTMAEAMNPLTTETAQACSDLLARATTLEKQIKDSKAVVKAPLLEMTKAADSAFDTPLDLAGQAKALAKARLTELGERQEASRRAQEATRLAEQARLDEEARKAAEMALKAKGKAKVEAEAKAAELVQKAAEASVVKSAEEAPKVAGVSTGKAWTAEIPQVGAVPEKYLIKHEGPLKVDKKTAYSIVQVDGALIIRDAEKLQGKPWLKLSSVATVKAGR